MWSVSNKSKTTADRSESFESGNSRCERAIVDDDKCEVINGGMNHLLDGDFLRVNLPMAEAKTHPSSMSKSPLEVYADSANELENLSAKGPNGSFDEDLQSFESEINTSVPISTTQQETKEIGEHLESNEANLLSFEDSAHIQNLIANTFGRTSPK